jgi:hypothetical protein
MSMKARLERLEMHLGKQVLIVITEGESDRDALTRWCAETGNDWPLNVLFVITGVNNAGDS